MKLTLNLCGSHKLYKEGDVVVLYKKLVAVTPYDPKLQVEPWENIVSPDMEKASVGTRIEVIKDFGVRGIQGCTGNGDVWVWPHWAVMPKEDWENQNTKNFEFLEKLRSVF